jgi:hypothetical protein
MYSTSNGTILCIVTIKLIKQVQLTLFSLLAELFPFLCSLEVLQGWIHVVFACVIEALLKITL